MFWFTMLILLNGFYHHSLGYITIDGDNQYTLGVDGINGCLKMHLDICSLCEHHIKQSLLEMNTKVTVCYTRPKKFTVADILRKMPEDTTYLEVH